MNTLKENFYYKRNSCLIYTFILIFLMVPFNIKAGIKGIDIEQWQKISNNFFIDTVDFSLNDTLLNFWIREKNYKKRRLTIDCKNLLEKELFEGKVYGWNGISENTEKFIIANQLCFLTKVKGFTPEPKFRQPGWVRKIIKLTKENNSKAITIEPKIERDSKTDQDSSNDENDLKNSSVLINNNNINSEDLMKNRKKVIDEKKSFNIEKKLIKKNMDLKSKENFSLDFDDEKFYIEKSVIKKDKNNEIQNNVDEFFNSIKNKKNLIFSGDSLKTNIELLPESESNVKKEKDNQAVQTKIMNFSNL